MSKPDMANIFTLTSTVATPNSERHDVSVHDRDGRVLLTLDVTDTDIELNYDKADLDAIRNAIRPKGLLQ